MHSKDNSDPYKDILKTYCDVIKSLFLDMQKEKDQKKKDLLLKEFAATRLGLYELEEEGKINITQFCGCCVCKGRNLSRGETVYVGYICNYCSG